MHEDHNVFSCLHDMNMSIMEVIHWLSVATFNLIRLIIPASFHKHTHTNSFNSSQKFKHSSLKSSFPVNFFVFAKNVYSEAKISNWNSREFVLHWTTECRRRKKMYCISFGFIKVIQNCCFKVSFYQVKFESLRVVSLFSLYFVSVCFSLISTSSTKNMFGTFQFGINEQLSFWTEENVKIAKMKCGTNAWLKR